MADFDSLAQMAALLQGAGNLVPKPPTHPLAGLPPSQNFEPVNSPYHWAKPPSDVEQQKLVNSTMATQLGVNDVDTAAGGDYARSILRQLMGGGQ